MTDSRKRFLRRIFFVSVSLGIIGLILSQGFLMMARSLASGVNEATVQRVTWQTPVVMIVIGVILTIFLEGIAAILPRRKKLTETRKSIPLSVSVPIEPTNAGLDSNEITQK